jgi:hypothetical protein
LAAFCQQLDWVQLSGRWVPRGEYSGDAQFAYATPTRINFRSHTFILRMDWDPVLGEWMPFLKGDPDGDEIQQLRRCLEVDPDWMSLHGLWSREIERFHDLRMYRRLGAVKPRKKTVDGADSNSGTGVHHETGAGPGLLDGGRTGPATGPEQIPPTVQRPDSRNGFRRVGSVWVRESEVAAAELAEARIRKRKKR